MRQTIHPRRRICAQSPAKIVHIYTFIFLQIGLEMHVMQRMAVRGTKNTITTVDKIVLHKYITILQNFFSVTVLGNICSHMYKKKKKRLITASCTFVLNLMQKIMITS